MMLSALALPQASSVRSFIRSTRVRVLFVGVPSRPLRANPNAEYIDMFGEFFPRWVLAPSVISTMTLIHSLSPRATPSVKGGFGDTTRQPHITPDWMLVMPLASIRLSAEVSADFEPVSGVIGVVVQL